MLQPIQNTLKGGHPNGLRDVRPFARSALFDEMNLMPHPNPAMIRSGILLAIASIALTASAQTNSWVPKKMSLDDCIETALQHNLDVRIKRYDPEVSLYTLRGAYGVYDPTLSLTVEHDYNQSAGGIDAQGRPFGGTETEIKIGRASCRERV